MGEFEVQAEFGTRNTHICTIYSISLYDFVELNFNSQVQIARGNSLSQGKCIPVCLTQAGSTPVPNPGPGPSPENL